MDPLREHEAFMQKIIDEAEDTISDEVLMDMTLEEYKLIFDEEDDEIQKKDTTKKKNFETCILLGLFNDDKRREENQQRLRKEKVVRNRQQAQDFINTWSDTLFYRQFRIPKEEFLSCCEKLKLIYPGRKSGMENYYLAQTMGGNSTPDGLTDTDINELFGNHIPNDRATRTVSKLKREIMEEIYDKGVRYNVQADNDFTYNNERYNR